VLSGCKTNATCPKWTPGRSSRGGVDFTDLAARDRRAHLRAGSDPKALGHHYQAPRSWTERAYPKLIYYNQVDKGGHFAAWEQPQLFSQEVRAAFRSLR
jgi:pimeloyl-ACP methyl ester carboxylesterase